jgi:hypothetical protein
MLTIHGAKTVVPQQAIPRPSAHLKNGTPTATCGLPGPLLAVPGFCQDLDIERCQLLFLGLINAFIQLRLMNGLRRFLGRTELADEIPEIDTFGKFFPAFPLDILADIAFDGIDKPRNLDFRVRQRECFSHKKPRWGFSGPTNMDTPPC